MAKPTSSFRHVALSAHTLAFVTFPLLGVLLYGHTLNVPFFLDDFISIRDKLYAIKALSLDELARASFEGFAPRRPLANLSFALNYYFHGLAPAGYHVVNIAIHVINGGLLYLLIFKTLTLPGQGNALRHPGRIALLSSLLWFVNPVQTQATTYLVQRMTCMAAMFFLASFLLYLYGRLSQKRHHRAVLFCAAVLCWVLALASKEIAFALPGLIYAYEWLFFQNLNMQWLKKSAAFLVGGIAVILGAVYVMYHYTPVSFLTQVFQPRGFTALERFLTESRVMFLYMSLIAWPYPGRLSLNHDIAVSRSLLDPVTTLLSFAGIFALLVVAIVVLKRCRVVSFAVIWFFANVAIEALAADIEIMFEHRVYLPSMLFFLPAVWFLLRSARPVLASSAAAAVILVFSFWTHERNALWKNPVAFWQDAVEKSPNHYRAHANLGISCLQDKAYDAAQKAFEKALSLAPPYPTEIYVNLGLLHLERGRLEPARENLNRALAINQNNYLALDLLGTVARREKKPEEAVKWYEAAIRVNPRYGSAYYNLGTLYKELGNREKALEALHQALALRPMWAKAYSALGLMHAQAQDYGPAEAALLRAVEIDGTNTGALFNLAKLYELTDRPQSAARAYETIIEIAPEDIEALHNLGVLYFRDLGNVQKCRFYLQRALDLNPQYDQAAVARKILSQTGGGS